MMRTDEVDLVRCVVSQRAAEIPVNLIGARWIGLDRRRAGSLLAVASPPIAIRNNRLLIRDL